MTLALVTKNKLGFINGSCPRPKDDHVLEKQWDRCNFVVLSWILSSVTEDLFLGQVFSKDSSKVWEELKETYDKVDGSFTFNLYQKINPLSQNGSLVSEYYHKLNSRWKQFDTLIKLPKCTCNASHNFFEHSQLMKLMQFLMGLDDVYQPIKSNILTRDPLPSVKTAFSFVSREESHRGGSGSSSRNKTHSAILSKVTDNKKNVVRPSNLLCKHCGFSGHTIERCFKLNGFPKDFQNRSRPTNQNLKPLASNVCVTDAHSTEPIPQSSLLSSPFPFSEQQVAKLLELLGQKSTFEAPSANMAGLFKTLKPGWIIDSGANQHMTSSTSNLYDIVDISDLHLKVNHPNGSVAKINKIGNFKLSNNITLFDVLVVPDFNVNLLSVHKLARDNKLVVGFDEYQCYVQDSLRKNVVGTGSQAGGLYFF